MNHLITITKSDGTTQLFEEEKLVNSLKRVGTNQETIDEVLDEVEKEMRPGIPTADIYNRAFALLKRHSLATAVKYSIRRAIMDLGPDGFPFEKYVARIFKQWGYESITDQQVLGTCVDHEVDVVAWNAKDLAMCEVKYHNEFGMKSDLKVALYVKARFDDLQDTVFNYGGTDRKLSERWLFTNTKFTDKAIRYGECTKLKLVGWNYPSKGSLHEIIEQNGLHPVTCMTKLTRDQKRELVGLNILTCIDIVGSPDVLRQIGIKPDLAEEVIGEAQLIIEKAK